MRKFARCLLPIVVLVGTIGATGHPAGAEVKSSYSTPDIKDQLVAIPGASSVVEIPNYDGELRIYRFEYEQPKDHRDASSGTFKQRVEVNQMGGQYPTILIPSHEAVKRWANPMAGVFTQNTVIVEPRFSGTSQPGGEWSKLDISQVAGDLHRVRQALKDVYPRKWLSAGVGSGAEIATYHRRFHPQDVQGTLAVGALNDVRNDDDSAYERYLDQVSTPECRSRFAEFQRTVLQRRDEVLPHFEKYAKKWKYSYTTVGSTDRAFEITVAASTLSFWRSSTWMCGYIPAPTAPALELFEELNSANEGTYQYSDKHLRETAAAHYLSATQTGWPAARNAHLDGLLRYPGINNSRTFLDPGIPLPEFDRSAMADVDNWVRKNSSEMLFVYGGLDSSSAEGFQVDPSNTGSRVHIVPNTTVESIGGLPAADLQSMTADLKKWAGVA